MSVCVRLLCALFVLVSAHAFIDEAVDVIHFGREIGEEVLNSWDLITKPFNVSQGVELPIGRRRERIILSRLTQVSRSIHKLELELEKTGAIVTLLARRSRRGTTLELRLTEMSDLLNRIADADRQMREYMRYQGHLEKRTLENFAEWCVSHDKGAVPGLLERVHSLVAPPHNNLLGRGVFDLVLEDLQQEDHPDLCNLEMSPHQLIYDMYNTISLTEIKGYAMMQFSWMLLRVYGTGNFTQEASITRKRYAERTSRTAVAARAALSMASRDVYRCSPPEHKSGETYDEVTRFLQGYLENEVDLNSDGTCRENCAYYILSERHGCFKDLYCSKQPACNGRVINCQYVDSDMWVCPASRRSNRRYDYIKYENGRSFGKPGYCPRGETKVDSWWRWLFWHCSYCMCLCDETGPTSDRYFSLWDTTSDVKNNKVVTGIRIVKYGQIFHLQVSEGLLGPRGAVAPGRWVPVHKFEVTDPGVRDGIDYHTLTYEKRAIDLDELDSPSGQVLTGVRFRMVGAHLHFEIRSTPFNYTTGRLTPEKSVWISNDNTEGAEKPRSKLELVSPDVPTRAASLRIDSRHDQYIEFTHTDFEADAAQSTVPFIDIQPLVPSKGGALLSGAGVYHRGAHGSGGFIGLKLVNYDLSKHVRALPPPADDVDSNEEFMPVVN